MNQQCQILCSVPNHNQMISFVCFNESCSEFRLACFECFQNGRHSAHPKDLKQMPELIEYLKNQKNEYSCMINEINNLQEKVNEKFEEYKQSIQYKLTIPTHKLKEINPQKINDVLSTSMKFKFDEIKYRSLNQEVNSFIQTLNNQILELNLNQEDKSKMEEAIQEQSSRILQNSRIFQNPFQYRLIESIKEEDWCNSISFNKESSIMIAGYRKGIIKIFEFIKGKISQIVQVQEHKDYVTCLQFMKKSNQFISASDDCNIIIWNLDDIGFCQAQQKLIQHNKGINSLLININEDLIITGSDDCSIKFWQKSYQWNFQQTLNIHTHSIRCMSLNQSSNQLISFAANETVINVSQKQSNNEWTLVQKIQQEGFRLYYIYDHLISVQPRNQKKIYIFKLNKSDKQFILAQEVEVKNGESCTCFFPQQFIKQKQILVSKNGIYINIIRLKPNETFVLEQSIQFKNAEIYGSTTDDGEFIVTWDSSYTLQVWQYHE